MNIILSIINIFNYKLPYSSRIIGIGLLGWIRDTSRDPWRKNSSLFGLRSDFVGRFLIHIASVKGKLEVHILWKDEIQL